MQDVLLLLNQTSSYGDVLDSYWIGQFVIHHEGYEFFSAQADYDFISLTATGEVADSYQKLWSGADAPDKKLGDSEMTTVNVSSVIVDRDHGIATVRYSHDQEVSRSAKPGADETLDCDGRVQVREQADDGEAAIYQSARSSGSGLPPELRGTGELTMRLAMIPLLAVLAFTGMQQAWVIGPKKDSPYDRRIKSVVYNPADTVEVNCVIGLSLTITVAPGERYVTHAFGDPSTWTLSQSGNHIIIWPTQANSDTNLTLITDRHMYQILLHFIGSRAGDGAPWATLPAASSRTLGL